MKPAPSLSKVAVKLFKGDLIRMKVVSWNVHRCIGADGRYSPERVADVLAGLDADLVALQEVDSSLKAADERDQLTWIASRIGMDAIMGSTLERDMSSLGGAYGNAILTRHSFSSCQLHDLSYRKFEPRGAMSVKLGSERDSRFPPIRITNVHLGLKYWERSVQIDRLLSTITWGEEDYALVLGDFNEWWRWSPNNLRLERAFLPCPRLATFPSRWPRFALDRVFLSGPVSSFEIEVVQDPAARLASDHLPLFARIVFP